MMVVASAMINDAARRCNNRFRNARNVNTHHSSKVAIIRASSSRRWTALACSPPGGSVVDRRTLTQARFTAAAVKGGRLARHVTGPTRQCGVAPPAPAPIRLSLPIRVSPPSTSPLLRVCSPRPCCCLEACICRLRTASSRKKTRASPPVRKLFRAVSRWAPFTPYRLLL